MSDYQQKNMPASTEGGMFIRVAYPALGAVFIAVSQPVLPTKNETNLGYTPASFLSEEATQTASTYSQSLVQGEALPSQKEFENAVAGFYSNLLADQEPLGEEFSKILHDNLWDLYES